MNLSLITFVARYDSLLFIPINEIVFLCRAGTIHRVVNDFRKVILE